jgi:glycosyltransferase involved in cell wall biosynthesis
VTGLAVTHGEHYLGSDDPDELARLIASHIQCPASLAQIGEAGRSYVRATHDWSVAATQVEGIYTRFLTAREGSRTCV